MGNNLDQFDDFDLDLNEEKGVDTYGYPTTVTPWTNGTNSSSSIKCATATNITEVKCNTCI